MGENLGGDWEEDEYEQNTMYENLKNNKNTKLRV